MKYYFSRSTRSKARDVIDGLFNVACVEDFGKYLGLPSFVGRDKRKAFQYIGDKIKSRVGGWQNKLLSKVAKETMLKSVAQSMPTFSMTTFLLPATLCDFLERMMNKYWWGGGGWNGRAIHWMAWSWLCKPKSWGGIGF